MQESTLYGCCPSAYTRRMAKTPREPERVPQETTAGDEDFLVLTVNQLVAYNLTRARRRAGWTQAEAAEKLNFFGGKGYTAATLGAAERSWKTGRSREFDANELAVFSLAFDQPIAFFFLPMSEKSAGGRKYLYSFRRPSEGKSTMELPSGDVLDFVSPVRLPAPFIEDVNELLKERGLYWQPSFYLERLRSEEAVPDETLSATPSTWHQRETATPEPESHAIHWEAEEEGGGTREITSAEAAKILFGDGPLPEILRRAAALLEQTALRENGEISPSQEKTDGR